MTVVQENSDCIVGTSFEMSLSDNSRVGFSNSAVPTMPTESLLMLNHHVNPATGNVLSCDDPKSCELGVHVSDHYTSRAAAIEESVKSWQKALRCSMVDSRVDEDFVKKMEAAVVEGFTISSHKGSRLYNAQVELLLTDTGIGYLVERILFAPKQKTVRDSARALNWALRKIAQRKKKGFEQVFEKTVASFLPDRSSHGVMIEVLGHNTDEPIPHNLSRVAGEMWAFRNSPLHDVAKALVHGGIRESSGYIPNPLKFFVEIPHTHEILQKLNISFSSLPSGVLAYDVETDTQNGFGLLPRRTQITELVVSRNDRSWVMAGDEKFILESFAALLNQQPCGYTLSGWNNHSFDNIMLQTRSEVHNTKNWGGLLKSAPNASMYEPVSPSGSNQSLSWRSPHSGVELFDVDLFQDKTLSDRSSGVDRTPGLKPFVESLGCTPIVVDRDFLHELTEEERAAYVLSDGIATLRASSALM